MGIIALGTAGGSCHDFRALAYQRCATVRTPYQQVEVWKTSAGCEFRVAGAVHALWHRDRLLTGLAWDNIAAASLLRPAGPPASVLMLGLAGGTALRILRHLLPECRFTAVDIDTELIDLAREHMHLDALGVEIHIGDAYEWITSCRDRFDVVIDDCYLAGDHDVFRPQKQPARVVESLRALLAPGGLLLANLLTGEGHRRMQSRTRSAFRRRFPQVRAVITPESLNETLVGGDAVLTARALNRWSSHFPKSKDRAYWSRISTRAIK